MHSSALEYGKRFFNTYCKNRNGIVIVDVGSQNVNGSLRDVSPVDAEYIGVDFASGNGIDIVLDDPYKLPFADESVDVLVCSSVFEHSQFFWILFLEIIRVLKPEGLFYLNAPSNGCVHRYPVDCWRFYPDSGHALVAWAKRNGYNPALLESFVGLRDYESKDYQLIEADDATWNDFVAVFVKEERYKTNYGSRIVKSLEKYANAYCDSEIKINHSILTDDFSLINTKSLDIANLNQALTERDNQIATLTQSVLEKDRDVATLTQSVLEKDRDVATLTQSVLERDRDVATLTQSVLERDNQINALTNSRSWRITKPFRYFSGMLRKNIL